LGFWRVYGIIYEIPLNPPFSKWETGKGFKRYLMERYYPKLKVPSRHLRNKSTEAEIILWSKIRLRQLNNLLFYRQKPLGGYIVDFYCPKAKLVLEVDGAQHYEKDALEYDRVRDEYLKNLGLTVLRFTNLDVIDNIEGVVEVIEKHLPQ
jgi:very-short-patch-repair endonuclease